MRQDSRAHPRHQAHAYDGQSSRKSFDLRSTPEITAYRDGGAFALRTDWGSVITWGGADHGGNSSTVRAFLSSGVEHVVGTDGAFAARKHDGSVVTWGDENLGGDSRAVQDQLVNEHFKNYKKVILPEGNITRR